MQAQRGEKFDEPAAKRRVQLDAPLDATSADYEMSNDRQLVVLVGGPRQGAELRSRRCWRARPGYSRRNCGGGRQEFDPVGRTQSECISRRDNLFRGIESSDLQP